MLSKTLIASLLATLPAQSQQIAVPFVVCSQSETWTRPAPEVQSKIWNDNRYKELGRSYYEWTHKFLWNDVNSASITYHNENLSGLWTAGNRTRCPRRDNESGQWTEIWSLNHHVAVIRIQGNVYTATVEPREKGFEIIQFRRPQSLGDARSVLRFVTRDGRTLEELFESSPSVFAPPQKK